MTHLLAADVVNTAASFDFKIPPAVLAILGFFYVIFFFASASWRPWMPLVLIFMSAPFPNDVGGGGPLHFSLAEVNLLLTIPVLLVRRRTPIFGPSIWPVLLYMGLAVAASLIRWNDLVIPEGDYFVTRKATDPITSLVQVAIYLVLTVMLFATLVKHVEDFRPVLHGFLAVCLFLAAMVVIKHTGRVLGLHKNAVGGTLSAAFIIALELGMSDRRGSRRARYMMLAGLFAIGCLGTLSRGSWIASGVGVVVLFGLRRQFLLLVKLGCLIVPLIAVAWLLLPAEQKEYATGFGQERWNIKQRYASKEIAEFYFKRSPIYGMGVGLRKQYDATNLAFCTLAETGVLGALSLSLIFAVIGWQIWTTQRQLPRDHLAFSVTAISGALVLGHVAHGMVDHYWGRGAPTVVSWASVGMAAHVADALRRHRRALRQEALQPAAPALPEGVPA